MSFSSNIQIDEYSLSNVIDTWSRKMRDDYRINRYFYDRPVEEQSKSLKNLFVALLKNESVDSKRLSELADAAFTVAFARGNAKPSMVNNRDFAFLGALMNGDILGDDDGTPELYLLCPAHSHFLRLQPIDEVYDLALDLLKDSLNEFQIEPEAATRLLSLVKSGKNGVMGRGKPIYQEDDNSYHFRTHG